MKFAMYFFRTAPRVFPSTTALVELLAPHGFVMVDKDAAELDDMDTRTFMVVEGPDAETLSR